MAPLAVRGEDLLLVFGTITAGGVTSRLLSQPITHLALTPAVREVPSVLARVFVSGCTMVAICGDEGDARRAEIHNMLNQIRLLEMGRVTARGTNAPVLDLVVKMHILRDRAVDQLVRESVNLKETLAYGADFDDAVSLNFRRRPLPTSIIETTDFCEEQSEIFSWNI